jgi:hypothetical protein
LLAREADTTLRPSDVSETKKVETSSAVYVDAKFLQDFKLTSDTLKSNQDLDSGGVESYDTSEEVAPVAMQKRSSLSI